MSRILGVDHSPGCQSLDRFEQLIHPDDQQDVRNPVQMSASEVLMDREYRVLRPNGELCWVQSHGRLIHSRDGRPERLVGVAMDVTEVRQGKLALQQREGLIAALREMFDIAIWTTDADGESRDEVEWWRNTDQRGRIGNWDRLNSVHPDDLDRVKAAWEQALRHRRRFSVACRVLMGYVYVPVVSTATAVLGRHGALEGWIGFTVRQDSSLAVKMDIPSPVAMPLSPAQVRAARGYLGWSAEQLAENAGVSFSTVRRVETPSERGVREQSVAAIRKALERAGISFSSGSDGRTGVSLKPA